MSSVTLVLVSPHMTGDVVAQFQRDANARLRAWDVPYQLDVDGDYGQDTRDTAKSLLYGLGVDVGDGDFDGVSPRDRLKIRHGYDQLNDDEKARWKDRADWRERFADKYGGGAVGRALSFARSKIGVTESPPNSNRGPQVDEWERACNFLAGPWCGAFTNACLVAAGLTSNWRMRYCPYVEADAKGGAGGWKWITTGSGDVQPGDIVLYGSGLAEHQGIVEKVSGGRDVQTIEGNTSGGPGGSQSNGGGVFRRKRHEDGSLGGFPIRGYARPPWS